MSAELATLAADPERVDSVETAAVPVLLGELEALRARLWQRLQSPAAPAEASPHQKNGSDRMLSAKEAAERCGVNTRWIYRKADDLPFTRRLSGGTLRFSAHALERWMRTR